MSDSYPGATEGELLGAPLARRLAAYSDQRRLFPRQGTLQLTPRTLILGGWRVIRREAVAGVRLTFGLPASTRLAGGRRCCARGLAGRCPRHETKAYRRTHPRGTDRRLRLRLPLPRYRARRPGAARLGGGAMTMPDDRTPATVQTTAEPPWSGAGRHVRGGISSALSREVSSRRSLLPGNVWMADSVPVSGRPALEVHAAGSLVDVMVASSRLPTACGELPSVEFLRGRIRRRAQPEETECAAGWFWFADADGRFSQVVVTSQRKHESCRIRMADAC